MTANVRDAIDVFVSPWLGGLHGCLHIEKFSGSKIKSLDSTFVHFARLTPLIAYDV